MCPNCRSSANVVKKGFYLRPSDKKKVQRYLCNACKKSFSDQTFHLNYRYRIRKLNQTVFRLLASGNSQRRIALNLNVQRKTIDRRIDRFAKFCQQAVEKDVSKMKAEVVMFDEMESSEHTKLKPLTIPVAIDPESRKILALDVQPIAAKGRLARISVAKYGKRRCERKKALSTIMTELKACCPEKVHFKTDESPHYAGLIRKFYPISKHTAYKGRRGSIVGGGEMKKIRFDPLFMLNHTYAMIRENVRRMVRKTWTTTKKAVKLKALLQIYACYHNQYVDGTRPSIYPSCLPN